ncbi:MAG: hypothetical protein WC755_02020 [Candidatus Woesearchaeota archaeon]|jgi:hypothetical protein
MKKFIDIRVTANSTDDLADICKLFMYISECGKMGSGGQFTVIVDGDGSGRYSFETDYEELKFADEAKDEIRKQIRDNLPIKIYLGE